MQTDRIRARDAFIRKVRTARFAKGLFCPRCKHRKVIRWGVRDGRQRYKCKKCGRLFNDLTGTPAAYLKKIHLLEDHSHCMHDSLTLRRVAKKLGIHVSTAFKWRHRHAGWLHRTDKEVLTGWIEMEMLRFAYSRKGERGLAARRKRGVGEAWFTSDPPVRVIFALDRLGNCANGVFISRQLVPGEVEKMLISRFHECSGIIAGTGLHHVVRAAAVRRGFPVVRAGWDDADLPAALFQHTRSAINYTHILLAWLEKFCGVATKYLANYLAWHGALDRSRRQSFEAVLLRWCNAPAS